MKGVHPGALEKSLLNYVEDTREEQAEGEEEKHLVGALASSVLLEQLAGHGDGAGRVLQLVAGGLHILGRGHERL